MKYQYVELFKSIEGEAKYAGTPTMYVRFTNCNFTCRGFNNPDNVDPMSPEALQFDPKIIKTVTDIKEISIGCDSIYAWNKEFKHLWRDVDEVTLATELTDLLPVGRNRKWWIDILSLTGGEPTLRQKTIPTLLNQPQFDTLLHVLIETNCSVPLTQKFIDDMNDWIAKVPGRHVTWSNSPKLSASGEDYNKAIVPAIALKQRELTSYDQYFKFVCSDEDAHFREVAQAMHDYHSAGVPHELNVYIMPVACTEAQQRVIMANVADMCIEKGYIYCHRIHNTVYDNAIGK